MSQIFISNTPASPASNQPTSSNQPPSVMLAHRVVKTLMRRPVGISKHAAMAIVQQAQKEQAKKAKEEEEQRKAQAKLLEPPPVTDAHRRAKMQMNGTRSHEGGRKLPF